MLEVVLKWNKKAIGELAICNYFFIFAIVLGKKLFLKRSVLHLYNDKSFEFLHGVVLVSSCSGLQHVFL
jgi:hypothetical protein